MSYLNEQLATCPFCGGTAHIYQPDHTEYAGLCRRCDAEGAPSNTHEGAIAAWNRRAPAAAPAPVAATDLSKRLRHVCEEGLVPLLSRADVLAAADEIERYYGGMLAWKRTAEEKDAALAAPPAPAAAPIVRPVADAVAAMKRAKALPVWDSIPHALHVELDTIFAAIAAPSVQADPAAQVHFDKTEGRYYAKLLRTGFVDDGELLYRAAPTSSTADAKDAARDVLAERRRQMEAEGWTPAHDDQYPPGTMARAAACYAAINTYPTPSMWPWAPEWWKPRDFRSNYVRAAALLLAEIEAIDRAAIASSAGEVKP